MNTIQSDEASTHLANLSKRFDQIDNPKRTEADRIVDKVVPNFAQSFEDALSLADPAIDSGNDSTIGRNQRPKIHNRVLRNQH